MTVSPLNEGIRSHPVGVVAAKRFVDVAASALGLVVLAPLFAVIALAIKIDDGGAVLYRQTRLGRGRRPFEILKFRSMSPSRGGPQLTVAGNSRVTRVGAVLRRTKLDELPQLWNVLVGEMSLVGPRPETPDLAAHYVPSDLAVMTSVRPGMTDYASLLLRDESTLLGRAADPEWFYRRHLTPLKARLCARYVRDLGPWTDCRIIFATILALAAPRWADRVLGLSIEESLDPDALRARADLPL